MHLEGTGKRLSIFCGESDRYCHRPLANAIVERAREEGLAGATVLRGIEGFGANSHLHTSRILSLSNDLPILIQIIDREDRIDAFVPLLEEIYHGFPRDEPQRVQEFYWTIRALEGPNALRLRKQIRREFGMGNLR